MFFEAWSGQLMPFARIDEANQEKAVQSDRLDSWKEVAAYFHRGERTVKRWEKTRGLPVHRVPGGGHASIFAYPVELDRWLESWNCEGRDLQITADEAEQIDGPAHPEPAIESAHPSHPGSMGRRSIRRKRLLMLHSLVLLGLIACVVTFAQANLRMLIARLPSHRTVAQSESDRVKPAAVSQSEIMVAHHYYLNGRYQWNQRTPDSLNRALDFFTQAIVHDPGNAQAYVGLADTYSLLREYATLPEDEAYARAISAARKAVELDDSLAEAHRALAFALTNSGTDFVNGEREYRKAIALNPKDPVARRWFANSFQVPSRFDECLEEMNRAQELDPTSNSTLADKGLLLFKAGKRAEGIELIKQVERSDPGFRSPHYYLMLISFIIRDYPTFLIEGEKAARSVNDSALLDMIAAARAGYARNGEPGLLQSLYAKQVKYHAMGRVSGTMLAKTCLAMGKRQEALDLLEKDCADHNVAVLTCLSEPDLLTLKDEPRYKALVKKINFPSTTQTIDPN